MHTDNKTTKLLQFVHPYKIRVLKMIIYFS